MADITNTTQANRARTADETPVKRFFRATENDTRLLGMVGAMLIIWIGFDILSGGLFMTPRNLWNLSVQTASVSVMATGMVLVIVTRNIDLSVGSTLGISAFAAQQGNGYSMGPGPRTLRDLAANLPPVQVLICYEAIFSRHVLANGPDRPDWLLQITNDAWFGTLSGPWQHLAQARLRAIESGLPVIRVANTGVSAVIDAHGQIRARLGLNIDGHIDTALPAALPPTCWSRAGDWPAILAAFALLAGLAIHSQRRLRLTRHPR